MNPGEVPIVVSDGVHDAFEQCYMVKAPIEFFTAARCKDMNIQITDKDILNGGIRIQATKEQRDKIKRLNGFDQGNELIIGNLDSKDLENKIKAKQKPMNTAQNITKSLFEIAVEGTNEEKLGLADNVKGHGDDLSIIVMAPENAVEQEVSKGKFSNLKAKFSIGR